MRVSDATALICRNSGGAFALLEGATVYHRLAAMDLPVLRSLIVELRRVSNESAASAVREGTPLAAARANRDAKRATAAEEALASADATS
jgi:hypothetical protein